MGLELNKIAMFRRSDLTIQLKHLCPRLHHVLRGYMHLRLQPLTNSSGPHGSKSGMVVAAVAGSINSTACPRHNRSQNCCFTAVLVEEVSPSKCEVSCLHGHIEEVLLTSLGMRSASHTCSNFLCCLVDQRQDVIPLLGRSCVAQGL